MRCKELVPGYVLTVSDLLNPRECAALVVGAETAGFEPSSIASDAGPVIPRGSVADLWTGDRPHLAATLWSRLSSLVPAELDGSPVVGLGEQLRIFRSDVGQRSSYDTAPPRSSDDGGSSRLSLLVYLNDDFRGGITRFRRLRVPRRMGLAVLFRPDLEHVASPVTSGVRYVLHTEVTYRRLRRTSGAARRWPTGWTTGRYP